jgi:predicted DNA-binding transcriptional regulator AlpA
MQTQSTTTAAAAAPAVKLRPTQPQDLSAPHWRLPAVLHFTGISRTTFLDMAAKGQAPQARKIPGRRVVLWKADEIRKFMDALPLATADDLIEG